eukprot:scaffold22560_cov135-Cylindrotheca_fusiformis.AAC.43
MADMANNYKYRNCLEIRIRLADRVLLSKSEVENWVGDGRMEKMKTVPLIKSIVVVEAGGFVHVK